MQTLDLNSFFDQISYDWKKDEKLIEHICKFTKTRVNPTLASIPFELSYGSEQTFLIKSIVEKYMAKTFFEIGTGRGTASYAVSSIPEIEEIHTLDIIPFHKKMNTAIGYSPAIASNKDLYDLISIEGKSKINFHQGTSNNFDIPSDNKMDICFIDGNHSDPKIIIQDFLLCQKNLKKGGIIIWDDYTSKEHKVKQVVDTAIKRNPDTESTLIEFRGHLFDDSRKEKDSGIVLMKFGE